MILHCNVLNITIKLKIAHFSVQIKWMTSIYVVNIIIYAVVSIFRNNYANKARTTIMASCMLPWKPMQTLPKLTDQNSPKFNLFLDL